MYLKLDIDPFLVDWNKKTARVIIKKSEIHISFMIIYRIRRCIILNITKLQNIFLYI